MGRRLGGFQEVVDFHQRLAAHKARDFQRQFRNDGTILDNDNTTLIFRNAVDGKSHILIVTADADDVMAVVGDRGGDRTFFQTIALQIADADVAGIVVTFYNGHFQDILLHIDRIGIALIFRDDLTVHHADDHLAAVVGKIFGGKVGKMEGIMSQSIQMNGDLRLFKICNDTLIIDQLAAFINSDHVKVLQIFYNGEVCQISGGDGTAVIEQEVAGCVQTCYLNRLNGIGTHADSLPADVVDVALFQQIVGMLVIGAEHAAVEILGGFDQRKQRLQIPGSSTFADHDELTQTELAHGIFFIGTFVVGVDTGRNVGIEVLVLQSRRMAVDLLVVCLRCDDFGNSFAVGIDDAGEIHHFRKTQHPAMGEEAVDIPIVQIGTGLIQRGSGNTGGNHEHGVHRQTLRGGKHIVDSVCTHDIGDLVGVGNDRGGAVGDDGADKFAGRNQTGFQMNVGIDEAGADHFAGHIGFDVALIAAKTHDQTLCNRDVAGFQLAGKDIDKCGIFQHKVCFFTAGSHINDVQLFNQFSIDLAGPGFCVTHSAPSLGFLTIIPQLFSKVKRIFMSNCLNRRSRPPSFHVIAGSCPQRQRRGNLLHRYGAASEWLEIPTGLTARGMTGLIHVALCILHFAFRASAQ